MSEIIPVINVADFKELEHHLRIAENYARWIHIDVADGSFTQTSCWHTPEDARHLLSKAKIEIHLMVADPEGKIAQWLVPGISRIIFHHEAAHNATALIERCHAAGKEAGVAIVPDTPWEVLVPLFPTADLLQTLAVIPGPSGQVFDRRILEKVRCLRALGTTLPIEVDGGVRVGVARECAEAGATYLAVASALFNPTDAFDDALRALNHDIGS